MQRILWPGRNSLGKAFRPCPRSCDPVLERRKACRKVCVARFLPVFRKESIRQADGLNQTFMPMAVAYGLDGAIINPLDKKMMANIIAAEALAGRDRIGTASIL